MASRLPGTEVIRIRPGEPDAIAAGLNPLEPRRGRRRQQVPAADARGPGQGAVHRLLPGRGAVPAGAQRGARPGSTRRPAGTWRSASQVARDEAAYPTLTGLQRAAERVVAEIGYSQRVTDDVLGFIRVRLASLRHGTTGRFLEGGHPLDFGALLRRNVVLEIEDVGDDADKAFLMGTVLIRLAEHLRLTHRAGRAGTGPGAPDRRRGGAPAAAPAGAGGPAAPGPPGTRSSCSRAARGDPRLRRGPGDRRADPGPPRPRRHQEHGGEDRPPAARGRRPGGGRRHDERHAARSPATWSPCRPGRPPSSPTAWTSPSWSRSRTVRNGSVRSPRPPPMPGRWSAPARAAAAASARPGRARCGTCAAAQRVLDERAAGSGCGRNSPCSRT